MRSIPDDVFGNAIILADVHLLGEQRGPAIDPEGDPAVRRRPVVERLQHAAELLPHPLERVALEGEALLKEVAAMDPNRVAAQLSAIEG